MKVTNRTAYATIGCDVQLSENDRLALGIELDKITNWLETVIGDESEVAESLKAVNKIVAFVSKFAIRPSETNVFTDSPLDFKKADETVTADDERMRKELLEHCINRRDGKQVCVDASDYRRWANWLEKQENKADETTTADAPALEDDIITVKIADSKKIAKLTIIIHRASDASIARIKDVLNSAEERCVSCISFRCINKRKEEVVDELIGAGYQIVPNGVSASLRL